VSVPLLHFNLESSVATGESDTENQVNNPSSAALLLTSDKGFEIS